MSIQNQRFNVRSIAIVLFTRRTLQCCQSTRNRQDTIPLGCHPEWPCPQKMAQRGPGQFNAHIIRVISRLKNNKFPIKTIWFDSEHERTMCPFFGEYVCVNVWLRACYFIVNVSRYVWCAIGILVGTRGLLPNQLTGVINPNGNVDKALLGLRTGPSDRH